MSDIKEQRRVAADKHTQEMVKKYANEIRDSIENTVELSWGLMGISTAFRKWQKERDKYIVKNNIKFINVDTTTALLYYTEGYDNVGVLDFASYTNPGGGYIKGSMAQEEALCSESYLYNVLVNMDDYYEFNRHYLHSYLYEDRMLYVPDIEFSNNYIGEVKSVKSKRANVLVCACPNWRNAEKYITITDNNQCMENRLEFIKYVGEMKKLDCLVLGAWGCGAFRQTALTVAKLIKKVFSDTTIKSIIIAVPGQDKNFTEFKSVFGEPVK